MGITPLSFDPHVIKLARLRAQTRLDVAHTLSVGQLSKRLAKILIETRKAFDLAGSTLACHATLKPGQRQMPGDLREYQFARVHPDLVGVICLQDGKRRARGSNKFMSYLYQIRQL